MSREPFDSSEGLLTVEEVSELYRVDRHTALTWARNYETDNGKPGMPAIRTPGNQWRFSAAYVWKHRG